MASSSLGDFLDAMVSLRAQKQRAAEFNYEQQQRGFSSLMGGLTGLGEGLIGAMKPQNQLTRQDALANQLYNRANPPRAQAVDPALQAGADTTPLSGQASYTDQPLTAGGPFTGGVEGLKMQGVLDRQELNQFKADTSRQGMIERNIHAGDTLDLKERTAAQLEEARKAREAQAAEREKDKLAMAAMGQTNKKYQDDVKIAHAHNLGMSRALANAAGAKTQADWEKAVTVITGLYQAGTKQGFKDLPFPEIPMSPDQKAAAATAVSDATNQDTWHWYNPGSWGNPSPEAIAAQQKEAQAKQYQYGGPADYEMAPEPAVPSNQPQDYYPGGPAYQTPSQAASQGPAPNASAPSPIPTISLQEARKKNPNITPGLKTDKNKNQILIQ